MSYKDNRPPIRISSLPVTKVDFLPTGKIWLACSACGRWVTTARGAIAAHRSADEVTRCKASGRRLEVDVPAEEHRRRRALAVAETAQRRAVYSTRRAHAEPRVPVPAPLSARPGRPRRAQVEGWPDGYAEWVNPQHTFNTARRTHRA
jgi:hypothetical protein